MVGYNGTILRGNVEDGFKNLAFHGDSNLNLLSVTKFRDKVIVASDHALHTFDGHLLSPLKPTFSLSRLARLASPLRIQGVGDVMIYFDRQLGVFRWDGSNWEEIVIPPELLERDFKGLTRQ